MISNLEAKQISDNEYLTFYIGEELVAIKLKFVETIEFVSEITPIPRAPQHVSGVAKIENSIIPIINLDILLDPRAKQKGDTSIAVIISIDTAVFGIYISEPPKVSTSDEKLINVDSKYKGKVPNHWIEGEIKQDEVSFFVLDPAKFWIGLGESEIVGPSSSAAYSKVQPSVIPEEKVDKKKEEKADKKKEEKADKKKEEKVDEKKKKKLDKKKEEKVDEKKEEKVDKKKKGGKKKESDVVKTEIEENLDEIKEKKIDDKLEDQGEKEDSKSKGKKKKTPKKESNVEEEDSPEEIDNEI